MSRLSVRSACSVAMAGMLLFGTLPIAAQDFNSARFGKGNSHFPNLFGPYSPRPMAGVTFQDSARLEDLIRDGVLYISLQDAIYLALENNLDIQTQRYGPAIAQTDLLSAKGGGIARGAAGTGAITSLGGGATSLDPVVTSTFGLRHATFPVNNPLSSGTGTGIGAGQFGQNTSTANVTYSQGFITGTQLQIASSNGRTTSSSQFDFFNPRIDTSLQVSISQPLLNGFGFAQNLRFIRVAKNNIQISDQQFAQQVMDIVSNVKRAYWELIFARENTKVAEQSLALAEKLHSDNRRQVEIGTLAPLELVRAEAEVARTRQQLIAAQTGLLTQQIILKDLLSRNPGDPLLANVTIEPLDRPEVPTVTEVLPVQDAIQIAMQKRPEVASQQLGIRNLKLQTKATRMSMLPSVNLFATWTGRGLSGIGRVPELTDRIDPISGQPILGVDGVIIDPVTGDTIIIPGTPQQVPTGNVITAIDGGAGPSLTQTIQGDRPDYQFGFQVSIPLRNRQAQASMARAQIEERRAETQYKRLINTVIVDVRNAQIALQQSRSQIDAATKARELAEETLRAEEKRFQLGASTIFLVIQAQRDLAQARSNEVRSLVDYQRALVDFDRALGRTLERSSITLQDAKTGIVTAGVSSVSGETIE